MPTDEVENDTINRPKRNPHKKTNWGEKSDKINHGKKTAFKRRLAEIEDDEDDIRDYLSR
jgi:hypothetical protein